jgi:hypothetical protein
MCLTLNLKSFIFTKVENETFPLSSTPYYTACIVNFEEGAVWIWKWHLLRLIPRCDPNHCRRAFVDDLNGDLDFLFKWRYLDLVYHRQKITLGKTR